jgi:serine/threonine protein kinase
MCDTLGQDFAMSNESDLDRLFEKTWFEPLQARDSALEEIGKAEAPHGAGKDAHDPLPIEPHRLGRCHLLVFRAELELSQSATDPASRAARRRTAVEHYERALAIDPTLALFDPHFLIDSVIGVGEVAYVFKVYQRARTDPGESALDAARRHGDPFALKVLKYRYDLDQFAVRRFGEALRLLQGPALGEDDSHLARVYDIYPMPPNPDSPNSATRTYNIYYRAKYVEGTPLTSYCDSLKRTDSEQAKLQCYIDITLTADQIADGMKQAHDLPVYHLDLKPANVLLSARHEQGGQRLHVMLVDFNYLVLQLAGLPLRGVTVLEKTISYLAPEVIRDITVGDKRSDIYSFGKLVIYLFEGGCDSDNVHECLERVVAESPRLAVLLRFCIDTDPIQRPPNFDPIIAGLVEAREKLTERLKSVQEKQQLKVGTPGPDTFIEFFIDLWREFRGSKTSRHVELRIGILVFGLLQVLLIGLATKLFTAPTKGWFVPIDGTILPAFLVGASYTLLGYTYFRNVAYPFQFYGSRPAEVVRKCMCAWYAAPIIVGIVDNSLWPFCCAAGMTGVTVHNYLMKRYCETYSSSYKDVFVSKRATQSIIVTGWLINAVVGTIALYAIALCVVWIRLQNISRSTVCAAELLLAALIVVANTALQFFATTGEQAKTVSQGMNLECEIRRWKDTVAGGA